MRKGFRKVLDMSRQQWTQGKIDKPYKIVLWCIPEGETSRTYKTDHVAVTVIIGKHHGTSARFPRKLVSMNKKNPEKSNFFKKIEMKRMIKEAFHKATRNYMYTFKKVKGEVLWFDKMSGEGMIRIPDLDFNLTVFACNIKGAKTWYPETACMYLNEGDEVTLDIVEVGSGATAQVIEGGRFDKEGWDEIKDKNLAFRCDENGKAINGLFGK